MQEVAGDYKDMGKRVRSLPALFDIDFRKKIVDGHKDYQQILSYPQPPIEKFAKSQAGIDEIIRIINDGFAELIAKERDHFPGWVAQISLAAKDAGAAECERAIKAGALGVQIYTNVAGQADRRTGIHAVLGNHEQARQADLAASGARRRDARLSVVRAEVALRDLVGASAGRTRPPAPWRGWCGPRSWTTIPT